jgi:hypothetical protein
LWRRRAAFAKVVAMTSSGWVLLNLWRMVVVVGPTTTTMMKPTTAIPEPEVEDRSMTTTTTFQSVLDWALFYHRSSSDNNNKQKEGSAGALKERSTHEPVPAGSYKKGLVQQGARMPP